MTPKIIPCPFCGGEMFLKGEFRYYHYSPMRRVWARIIGEPNIWAWFTQCRCCAAVGPWSKSKSEAIRLSNERVS